jgi:hypothetical protein
MVKIDANTPELQQAISGCVPGEVCEITLKVMVSDNQGFSMEGEIEPGSLSVSDGYSEEMELPEGRTNDEVEGMESMNSMAKVESKATGSPGAEGMPQKKMPPVF